MNQSYYVNNRQYSHFLNRGDISTFEIYTNAIKKYIPHDGKFLDIGCGPGLVVDSLTKEGINAFGIEISKSSLQLAKQHAGTFTLYGGTKIPYPDSTFNVVGSIDVLEHVEDVPRFLNESVRVLKKDGFLIICAPNFLSLTSSYHYRTAGLIRKTLNLLAFIKRLITFFTKSQVNFEKFSPVTRLDFHPDDDATNLINPLDILKWGRQNRLKLVEYAGSFMPPNFLSHHIGKIPMLNLIAGGVFAVFKK